MSLQSEVLLFLSICRWWWWVGTIGVARTSNAGEETEREGERCGWDERDCCEICVERLVRWYCWGGVGVRGCVYVSRVRREKGVEFTFAPLYLRQVLERDGGVPGWPNIASKEINNCGAKDDIDEDRWCGGRYSSVWLGGNIQSSDRHVSKCPSLQGISQPVRGYRWKRTTDRKCICVWVKKYTEEARGAVDIWGSRPANVWTNRVEMRDQP
jgi:hypothetical protein